MNLCPGLLCYGTHDRIVLAKWMAHKKIHLCIHAKYALYNELHFNFCTAAWSELYSTRCLYDGVACSNQRCPTSPLIALNAFADHTLSPHLTLPNRAHRGSSTAKRYIGYSAAVFCDLQWVVLLREPFRSQHNQLCLTRFLHYLIFFLHLLSNYLWKQRTTLSLSVSLNYCFRCITACFVLVHLMQFDSFLFAFHQSSGACGAVSIPDLLETIFHVFSLTSLSHP